VQAQHLPPYLSSVVPLLTLSVPDFDYLLTGLAAPGLLESWVPACPVSHG
jgi:hypothetical protein